MVLLEATVQGMVGAGVGRLYSGPVFKRGCRFVAVIAIGAWFGKSQECRIGSGE